MVFEPHDRIALDELELEFTKHPHAPGLAMAYCQEGRKAQVFQVRDLASGRLFALKVFQERFREPAQVSLAEKIAPFSHLPGISACERRVLTRQSHPALVRNYPELEFSVVMPWVEGQTWWEHITSGAEPSLAESVERAVDAALVLSAMEENGLAHCDISGGNVLIAGNRIMLVDLEDMYSASLEPPGACPAGTDGYQHRSARTAPRGQWHPAGDRFAGAILIAEMLVWHDRSIRKASADEQYFDKREMQTSCSRYKLLFEVLGQQGENVAKLFSRVWAAARLEHCPALSDWSAATRQIQIAHRLKATAGVEGHRAVYDLCCEHRRLGREIDGASSAEEGDLWGLLLGLPQIEDCRDSVRAAIEACQAFDALTSALESKRIAAVLAMKESMTGLQDFDEFTPDVQGRLEHVLDVRDRFQAALEAGRDEEIEALGSQAGWDWQDVLSQQHRQRLDLALRRMEACREIRRAEELEDDEAILALASEHQALLAGSGLVDEQRQALAGERLQAVEELRAALEEETDVEVWSRMQQNWHLLESSKGFREEEQNGAHQAQVRLLKKALWVADASLLADYGSPPLFRDATSLSSGEIATIDEALDQQAALTSLRSAFESSDPQRVCRVFEQTAQRLKGCHRYTMAERLQVIEARRAICGRRLAETIEQGDASQICLAAEEARQAGWVADRQSRKAIRKAQKQVASEGRAEEALTVDREGARVLIFDAPVEESLAN